MLLTLDVFAAQGLSHCRIDGGVKGSTQRQKVVDTFNTDSRVCGPVACRGQGLLRPTSLILLTAVGSHRCQTAGPCISVLPFTGCVTARGPNAGPPSWNAVSIRAKAACCGAKSRRQGAPKCRHRRSGPCKPGENPCSSPHADLLLSADITSGRSRFDAHWS